MTRLRLRDDAYYAPTDDGICILTNSGDVVLTGQSIYQWVDRIAPYLDGRYTLAELTASLPPERKAMTERVVNALRERGVVVEAEETTEAEWPLSDAEERLYHREIGYLGYFGTSAKRSFRALRDSPVVIVGAGPMLVETVQAAVCSGSRRLHIALAGGGPDLVAECERRIRPHDPDQEITREILELSDGDRLGQILAGAGIVVYVGGRTDIDDARALDLACARSGVPFVAAIVAGGEAWLGPFGPVAGGRPTWTSAWRRLLALDRAGDESALPPSGPVSTVVANQLAREVVRLLSGTAEPTLRLSRVELRSLRTRRHGFLPHPLALTLDQTAGPVAIDRLGLGERIDAEEFSQRVTAVLDARLGVLGEVTEHDFAQVPLAVSQVQVSDPVLLLGPDAGPLVVTGADLSLAGARRAAVLRGLATYGSLMVDPRRLHVRTQDADPRTGDAERDLATLRAGEWTGFAWGRDLTDGRPRAVAAAAAFPALAGIESRYVVPVGAAAGYDWAEAVCSGLVGQCRELTLAEIGTGPVTPIDWSEVALDERGHRCRVLVKAIGGRLDVFDVTGRARVPTLAFCLEDATLAYASGLSFAAALRDGLAQVLLSHQAELNGDVEYAPAPVPPLPERKPVGHVDACPAWSTDEATVAAGLARLGWTAVAVPLDHDPGVANIMPNIVHIVLTRD